MNAEMAPVIVLLLYTMFLYLNFCCITVYVAFHCCRCYLTSTEIIFYEIIIRLWPSCGNHISLNSLFKVAICRKIRFLCLIPNSSNDDALGWWDGSTTIPKRQFSTSWEGDSKINFSSK